MPSKMVTNFRRSLSFPSQPGSSSSSTKLPKKAYHVRSTSLPCRSHPLVSQLRDEINELKSWASSSKPDNHRTSAWLCDGLSQLTNVQESLDDLLQLPQARESLCPNHDLIEKFLDDFLGLVDVYGIFQTLLFTLKQEHLAAQVAVRKRDDSKTALYLKILKKIAKDFGQLESSVQSIAGRQLVILSPPAPAAAGEDAEIARVLRDAIQVTASISAALFNGLSVSLAFRKPSCVGLISLVKNSKKIAIVKGGIQEFQQVSFQNLWGLQRKGEEELKLTLKIMHELEGCIRGIGSGGERVFRSLISTRVSLLNVVTH
ncbi:unnamed protein product [Coffea canephora]|uniref:Uncharacterized protein n=1 Tax=Coffea canephora TaxID=49390 RepID=A0A068UFR8_COFCA|nr:unnamed protein product [Coffea canephora]